MGSYDPRHNNNTFALAPSDGPYNVLDEQQYFQPGAGGHVNAGGEPGSGIVFQPETGNFATPPYASLHRFLSPDVVADFPKRGADPEGHVNGSNAIWNYHKYITTTEKAAVAHEQMSAALASPAATAEGKYDHVYMYGEPADTEAYCKRAQLALFAQYKALFEGYLEHMFAKQTGKQFGYTAVIFWKSQSPWPSLRGALYDSYLATTGGFWGARAALAQPVHVQMNAHTQTLTVVNLRPQPTPPLTVRVKAYTLPEGKELPVDPEGSQGSISVAPVPAVSRRQLLLHKLPWPADLPADAVVLYRLELYEDTPTPAAVGGAAPLPLSSNTYWRSRPDVHQDYSSLASCEYTSAQGQGKAVSVSVSASPVGGSGPSEVQYAVRLKNTGSAVAFGVWLEVHNATAPDRAAAAADGSWSETRLLPAWFGDNLLALLPGEEVAVSLRVGQAAMQSGQHEVRITGWNVAPKHVVLPPPNQRWT